MPIVLETVKVPDGLRHLRQLLHGGGQDGHLVGHDSLLPVQEPAGGFPGHGRLPLLGGFLLHLECVLKIPVILQGLQPGQALLSLRLGTTDRVERSVPIQPAGRRITTAQGGTLGVARELRLTPEETLKPTASSVSLTVYPGPLSFVMAELAQASARIQDLPSAACAFALVGQGGALARRWGVEPGAQGFPKAQDLRALRLRAWQGLVKGTRAGRNQSPSDPGVSSLETVPRSGPPTQRPWCSPRASPTITSRPACVSCCWPRSSPVPRAAAGARAESERIVARLLG